MRTPWNKSVTQKWIEIDCRDAGTFPHVGQKVIAVDDGGAQAACVFDSSGDFLYDVSGFDAHELAGVVRCVLSDAIRNAAGTLSEGAKGEVQALVEDEDGDLTSDLFALVEDALAARNTVAYFGNVRYWMPAPPAPIDIALDEEDSADEVTFLTYDVLTALEPSIRAAIKGALSRQGGAAS